MIIVSDTSALIALMRIGEADLLPQLFDEVVIPEAVQAELQRKQRVIPHWLRVEPIKNAITLRRLALELDPGESEAIVLALELPADRLLIDEKKGRQIAKREGLQIIGLMGVLLAAKRKGIVASVRDVLSRLENEGGFYVDKVLRNDVLTQAGE